MPEQSPDPQQLDELRQAIASGDPGRAMPALASLRQLSPEQAVPLLLLGLQQQAFMIRSLSCAGLGYKQSEPGWQALAAALLEDDDPNVRAEAANAMVSHDLERAQPLLTRAFAANDHWLVRCSILSAVAELVDAPAPWLFELASQAITDADGTVRVAGAEVMGRLAADGSAEARAALLPLQTDSDHRVVAAALNGLQR